MTSTRIIRPKSFKIDTTTARNRPTVLPTPARLKSDVGVFQDIGSKLVRPKSRKQESHLARIKGLRTSAGLEQQLIKEQGLKIRIGDKTLEQLLQVEVPDTRKQEYIKADGSIGVRIVPVLDKDGNPVLVKKILSIPGSIEHFQKPIRDKLNEIGQVLLDQTKTIQEKSDTIAVLLMSAIGGPSVPSPSEARSMGSFAEEVHMAEDPIAAGLPSVGLEEGRFAPPNWVNENQSALILYLMKFGRERGLPEGSVLFDARGDSVGIGEVNSSMFFDSRGNPRRFDILTSRILPSSFETIGPPSEFQFEKEDEPSVPTILEPKSDEVGQFLVDNFTPEQQRDISKKDFNESSANEQMTMLQVIIESREEFEEEGKEIIYNSDAARDMLKHISPDEIITIMKIREINLGTFNRASPLDQEAMAETIADEFGGVPEELKLKPKGQVKKWMGFLTDEETKRIPAEEFNAMSEREQDDLVHRFTGSEARRMIIGLLPDISEDELKQLQEIVDLKKFTELDTKDLNDMNIYWNTKFPRSEGINPAKAIARKFLVDASVKQITALTEDNIDTLKDIINALSISETGPSAPDLFLGSLDENEQKTFASLREKKLKDLDEDARIIIGGRTLGSLRDYLQTGKALTVAVSQTILRALGVSITSLSTDEKALILKMINLGVIIGSGKKKLEGRGMKEMIMRGMCPMETKYGYINPVCSMRQNLAHI